MKILWGIGSIFFLSLSLSSCNGNANNKIVGSNQDTTIVDCLKKGGAKKDTLARGKLAERLKEPVQIPVDTLNPISKDSLNKLVRYERKRIKDSVRLALDKLPKHIYLTFDDGPLLGSAAIDSIATAKNVKISVFLVGKHANMSKKMRKVFEKYYNNPLVECYNHSYTHASNRFSTFYSNPIHAFNDFDRNEKDLTLKHKIVRMPGRNIWIYQDVRRIDLQNGASTADMLQSNGYRIYGWDLEWKINGVTGKPEESVAKLFNHIKNYMNNKSSMEPNNVVLLTHDNMYQSKKGQELLVSLIDTIQKNTDYKFEFIQDYPFRY